MQPDEHDVVLAERLAEDVEVEVVGRPGVGHAVAPERRRVEDDPLAGGQRVSTADVLARPGEPLLAEEHVGPRDPEARHEALQRLAERLRIVRRGGLRRDETDVVVGMDPDPAGQRLVHPERLVEDAVADLLERAAGVPGLDDRRPPARLDDIDREEVVVHDEHARRGQIAAGDDGMPSRGDASARADRRPVGEDDDLDLGVPSGQIGGDGGQVPADPRRMGSRQDDPGAQPASPEDGEGGPDQGDPDGQDEPAHRVLIDRSTRPVVPTSRG